MSLSSRRHFLTGAAATAASLGAPRSLRAEPVALQLTASPSIWQKTFEDVLQAYAKTDESDRVALASAFREDEEHVQFLLRAVISNNLPELVIISTSLVNLLASRGIIQPIDQTLGSRAELQRIGIVKGAEAVGEFHGKLYGLPVGISVPVIAFNADLISRAGGDPEHMPGDWDRLTTLARKVTELGGGVLGGFFEYDNTANWTFQALITTFGGKIMSDDGRSVGFDGPVGAAAFQVLHAFGEAGQGHVDMTRDQARQAFAAGTIGLIVTSSGTVPGLEKQSGGHFLLRTMRFPIPHPLGRIPAAGEIILTTSQDDAKQRAAVNYMRFVAGPDAQTLIARATGLVAINEIALSDPGRLASLAIERPNLQAALSSLPVIGPWSVYPGENGIKIVSVVKDYLQAVLTLKQAPEQALASLTRDVNALLKI
jgi:multiple sugar transport system substrate-binding protein